MTTTPNPCPHCQAPMTPGTVEIHGTGLGFLLVGFSWQELYFRPAGEAEPEQSVLVPNSVRAASRCPTCGTLVIRPGEPAAEEALLAQAAEPAECLACGAVLPPGQIACPQCGWSYREPVTRRDGGQTP